MNTMSAELKVGAERAVGTSLQGYVDISYEGIIDRLGFPGRTSSGDGKITRQWTLQYGPHVITIYDYKGDCSFDGKTSAWHIGGKSLRVLEIVEDLLGTKAWIRKEAR